MQLNKVIEVSIVTNVKTKTFEDLFIKPTPTTAKPPTYVVDAA